MHVPSPTGAADPQDVEAQVSAASSASSEAIPRRSPWFIGTYGVTYFAFMLVTLSPALFSLAYKMQVLDPINKETNLGLVVGTAGAVNLLALPLAGVLSDSSRSRFGRRRPFLLGGVIVCLGGALVIATAGSVLLVMAGWVLSTLGLACVGAGINPVVAENVPESQRGAVGAFGGVAAQLAGVAATLLGGLFTGNVLAMMLVPAIILAIAVVPFMLMIPDPVVSEATPRPRLRQVFGQMVFNPQQHKDFGLVWLGKLSMQFGLTTFSTYQLYFLLDRLGLTAEQAGQRLALVGGLGILMATGSAVFGGMLSDKLNRRKVFIYVAAALNIAGLWTMAVSDGFLMFCVGALLITSGAGLFGSVDIAMAAGLVPERDNAGRWMSIYSVAAGVPTAIAPIIAPVILNIGGVEANYTAPFLFGGAVAVGTLLTPAAIRGAR